MDDGEQDETQGGAGGEGAQGEALPGRADSEARLDAWAATGTWVYAVCVCQPAVSVRRAGALVRFLRTVAPSDTDSDSDSDSEITCSPRERER